MKCVVFLAVLGLVSGCQRGASVAFTALLSKDTTMGAHAVVKYDRVLTNWGRAYQPRTGVFTAPYNGLYSISCSLMSYPSNSAHVNIAKNGDKMSVLFSNTKTFPLASQTLQLLLRKGDKIWIQNWNNRKSKLHDHGSYNVFSGFLINEI